MVHDAPYDTCQSRAKWQEGAINGFEHGEDAGDPRKARSPAPPREMGPECNEGCSAGNEGPVSPTNVEPGQCLLALEVRAEIGPRLGDIDEAKQLGALLRLIVRDFRPTKRASAVEIDRCCISIGVHAVHPKNSGSAKRTLRELNQYSRSVTSSRRS